MWFRWRKVRARRGGAVYFQEGTFHHTQVETPYGPSVRCANAGVFRYEPRAQKFDASKLSSGEAPKAGSVFDEGDVLHPKIENVRIYAAPEDAAKVAATVKKVDELVFLGEEKDGFLKVQGSTAEGWVKKTLVSKK